MAAGQPKPLFYVAVGLVVILLIAFAVWRSDIFAPAPKPASTEPIKLPGGDVSKGELEPPTGVDPSMLTAKEPEYVPADRLPPVKGTSGYKPLSETNNTVRFALNVWAGWSPIIFANDGFKPGKVWKSAKKDFLLELVLIDDPVAMRDSYANGDVHIGWGTLDMVPLFLEGFVDQSGKPRDTRIMPRIYQQIDWSNGGDGVVVRDTIKSVSDLRGQNIVLAQNSPSHYFALNMLVRGGLQPHEVKMTFTKDAFQAAAAYNADRKFAGAVSWAPDIYTLSKARGNKLLVTTAEANKLIADIWFARADFARDHEDIIEALVRGIFDSMEELKKEENKKKVAELMAKGYNIPPPDALGMLGDAHSTNWAENYQFFMNDNNPTNFRRVWDTAYYLYRHPQVKAITHDPVPYDQVMDFSIIKKLGEEDKYKNQKDEYSISFTPATPSQIEAESPILGNTFQIRFFPNSHDLSKKIVRKKDGKDVEEAYDPNVDFVLEEIAKLAGTFGAARLLIEGHTDASMRPKVAGGELTELSQEVKKLSENRANAVKQALVAKYKFNPNQLTAKGMGWEQPADPNDPGNHAKNRRVEVKVYSPEKQ